MLQRDAAVRSCATAVLFAALEEHREGQPARERDESCAPAELFAWHWLPQDPCRGANLIAPIGDLAATRRHPREEGAAAGERLQRIKLTVDPGRPSLAAHVFHTLPRRTLSGMVNALPSVNRPRSNLVSPSS